MGHEFNDLDDLDRVPREDAWDRGVMTEFVRECRWALDQYWHRFDWSGEDTVLDLGCCSGYATYHVLLPICYARKLVGSDHRSVSYPRNKYAAPHLSFQVLNMDTTDDPLAIFDKDIRNAGGFDKIFSFFYLQYIKNKERMAANLYKLLKPGGKGCVMLAVKSDLFNTWDCLMTSEEFEPYLSGLPRPVNDYNDMEDYEQVFKKHLTDAGLKVLDCTVQKRRDAITLSDGTRRQIMSRLNTIDPHPPHLLHSQLRQIYLREVQFIVTTMLDRSDSSDYTALVVLFEKKKISSRPHIK